MDRQADLRHRVVFEKFLESVGDAEFVESEKEAEVVGGELQQGDLVGMALTEGGTRLGVEADHLATAQLAQSHARLLDGVDDGDAAGIGYGRQLVERIFGNRYSS